MKTYSLVALLALSAVSAHADIQGTPFMPEEDARFNALEQGNHLLNNKFPMGSADGHWVQQEAQATYDFAKNTGGIANYDLGVPIPAGAIVTRSYLYSITKPTTSASGTLSFYCSNSANPEFKLPLAAASYPSAGALAEGIQTGTAANMSVISSKCDVHAGIATGALTAGKVTLFLNYVVHQ